MAKRRSRSRRQFGLAPQEHATNARNWMRSADSIMLTVDRVLTRDPCRAIEHYTDAISEATVAEVQFHQAGDDKSADFASKFRSKATRRQREAVKLCRLRK